MSKVLVLAPTGFGKTFSLRNLNPDRTGIINIDKKELPLRKWRTNYVTERDSSGKILIPASNYIETSKPAGVKAILEQWEVSTRIETIAIDTITHLITADYIVNTIGKDYKAYQTLGKTFYDIIELIRDSKKDIVVFAHSTTQFNDSGDKVTDMQVLGGKMIQSLVPASYFTTVLMGEVHRKDGKAEYVFRTQSLGNDPAKSPAYEEDGITKTALEMYEPNDMQRIFEKLKSFEY